MRADRSFVDRYFEERYRRGAIIRFCMQCDDPEREQRNKFGIVLNKDISEPDALLALTTSNVQAYASGVFDNDIMRLTVGAYPCFPKETIIVLRQVRIEPVELLKALCMAGQMTFEGGLNDEHREKMDGILAASIVIERGVKKRIV
jgi:hypothetical protein